jgi:hypothetical protein
MNYFEEVKNEIFKYRNLGEEKAENGTLLIGRAPHIARLAWLHSIYPTLNEQDIAALKNEVQTDIPDTYKQFLKNCSNGLTLFVRQFSLYGLRKQSGRGIEASRQPFSPVTANIDERPKNTKDSFFFIGGYSWDGSKIYIDKTTSKVHYCDRWDATSLFEWPSFEEMLVSEVRRICGLFDEKGVIKDPDKYTTPIPRKMA